MPRARNARAARFALARSRSRAGLRDHPPQAPGLDSRRSPPARSFAVTQGRATGGARTTHRPTAHGRAAARIKHRRWRWAVLRTQRTHARLGLTRAAKSSGARDPGVRCEQHRARDAVAIAPRPGRARWGREDVESSEDFRVRRSRALTLTYRSCRQRSHASTPTAGRELADRKIKLRCGNATVTNRGAFSTAVRNSRDARPDATARDEITREAAWMLVCVPRIAQPRGLRRDAAQPFNTLSTDFSPPPGKTLPIALEKPPTTSYSAPASRGRLHFAAFEKEFQPRKEACNQP
jgi:hypothetical protein